MWNVFLDKTTLWKVFAQRLCQCLFPGETGQVCQPTRPFILHVAEVLDIRAAVSQNERASVTGIAHGKWSQADYVPGEPHRVRNPDTVPTYSMSCGLSVPCGSAHSHKARSGDWGTLSK